MFTGWTRVGLAVLVTCGTGACQSAGGGAFGTGGSPLGKPIALESIEGAPAAVQTALASELAHAASARQVELVGDSASARYRVRGYLSTEPTADGGTALAFVWDVFDAEQRRARRLAGSSPIGGSSRKSPWEGLDREALARLAAQSMDEIATFLTAGVPSGEQPGSEVLPSES